MWGLKYGLAMGVLILLYACLRVGSFAPPPRVVATYLIAGAIGGLLTGACLPLARTRPGAAVLGVVAATPLFVLLAILDDSVSGADAVPFWIYVLSALLVGSGGGYLIRDTVFSDLD